MPNSSTSLPTSEGGVEPWVSIDEVAAHLGVRKDSIYRWIEHRGLPAEKVGKLWKLKLSSVDAWMRGGGRRRRKLDRGPAPSTSKVKVLVVDDDQALRETLGDFLADQGYQAVLAGNGEEALALLRTPSGASPALIILDLNMPGMDGWAFREEQARDPKLRDIPVLLISAERCFELASAGMLWKPIDLSALEAAVARLTRGPT